MKIEIENATAYVLFSEVKPTEFFSWHGGLYLKIKEAKIKNMLNPAEVSMQSDGDESWEGQRNAVTLIRPVESKWTAWTGAGDLTYFSSDIDVIPVKDEVKLKYGTHWDYHDPDRIPADELTDRLLGGEDHEE